MVKPEASPLIFTSLTHESSFRILACVVNFVGKTEIPLYSRLARAFLDCKFDFWYLENCTTRTEANDSQKISSPGLELSKISSTSPHPPCLIFAFCLLLGRCKDAFLSLATVSRCAEEAREAGEEVREERGYSRGPGLDLSIRMHDEDGSWTLFTHVIDRRGCLSIVRRTESAPFTGTRPVVRASLWPVRAVFP